VAHLVEAMRYKSESRRLIPRDQHYGRGGDSASMIKEYQMCFLRDKGGRCVGLTDTSIAGNPMYLCVALSMSFPGWDEFTE